MSSLAVRSALTALLLAPVMSAQTVLAVDNTIGVIHEFTAAPGGPCLAPNPFGTGCGYGAAFCPGVPPLAPLGAGTLLGDIADDPITDRTWVTDGRVIVEFAGDPACGGVCTPIRDFFAPIPPGAGPVTGMGCSATGSLGPAPVLWLTDGVMIWGATPPAAVCGAATIVFGPCPVPTVLVPATDLSWDGGLGVLWVSGATGLVMPVSMPGCAPAAPPVSAVACGLGTPLTGIAYDTSTPNFTGQPRSAFVTDGNVVAYMNLATGLAAPPTFHAPVPCTPAPSLLSGLALAQRGVEYAKPRIAAHLTSFGQSSTPGPSFGLQVTGVPPGTNSWLVLNFNLPGPGFLCPPLPGLGTFFHVDPGAPALTLFFAGLGPGCNAIPLPIPAATPVGVRVFAQMFFVPPGGPPVVDATNGLAFTIGAP